MNHETIAEGFSQALVEISEDLGYVGRGSRISNTPEMKRAIVKLYIQVFNFFGHAMTWYSSRFNRFKASVNAKFYDKTVLKIVGEIKRLVGLVKQEADLATQERVSDTSQQLTEVRDVLEVIRQIGDRTREKINEQESNFKSLGQTVRLSIGAFAQHHLHNVLSVQQSLHQTQQDQGQPRLIETPEQQEESEKEGSD